MFEQKKKWKIRHESSLLYLATEGDGERSFLWHILPYIKYLNICSSSVGPLYSYGYKIHKTKPSHVRLQKTTPSQAGMQQRGVLKANKREGTYTAIYNQTLYIFMEQNLSTLKGRGIPHSQSEFQGECWLQFLVWRRDISQLLQHPLLCPWQMLSCAARSLSGAFLQS